MKRRSFLSVLGMTPALAVLPAISKVRLPVASPVPGISGPEPENKMLDVLATLQSKGIPIPLNVWAKAADINLHKLYQDLEGDAALRKLIS